MGAWSGRRQCDLEHRLYRDWVLDQVGTKRKIYDGFLTSLDLSKDGNTLYVGGYDDVNADRPAIKAVTIATGSTTPIYVGTTAGSFFYSVDAGDAAVLYADLSLPANTGHELMRFTLPCAGSCASVIAANAAPVYPAASSTGSSHTRITWLA